MILSNVKIYEALDNGWLRITPEPEPRFPSPTAAECPYQTSAVDLRLAGEIVEIAPKKPISIDLRSGGFKHLAADAKQYQITSDQPFQLSPGRLILGQTLETIDLPLPQNSGQPCYAARVEGRSSYARCGLLVHFTAPTIHAGYCGTITLEIMNFGPYPILLHPNTHVCQLIIEEVSGVPVRNESQFQGQTRPFGGLA